MDDASPVKSGYGWGVGAVGLAFLSGFFGWISDFAASRVNGRSPDMAWQIPLVLTFGAGVVALLLALAAWRRGGGKVMGTVAAIGAVASMVASPILVVGARPHPTSVQVQGIDPVHGSILWTSHPHLVGTNLIRALASGLIEIDGFKAQGHCNSIPAVATLDAHTGSVLSLTGSTPVPDHGSNGPALAGEPGASSVTVSAEPPTGPDQLYLVEATVATSGRTVWQRLVSAAPGSLPLGVVWSGRDTVVLSNEIAMKSALRAGLQPAFAGPPISAPASPSPPAADSATSVSVPALPTVLVLSAADGHQLWQTQVSATDRRADVAADSTSVVTSDASTLTWRDARTGSVLASTSIPTVGQSQVAVAGSSAAVLDGANVLTGFDSKLIRRWQLTISARTEDGPVELASASDEYVVVRPGRVAGSNCGGE